MGHPGQAEALLARVGLVAVPEDLVNPEDLVDPEEDLGVPEKANLTAGVVPLVVVALFVAT